MRIYALDRTTVVKDYNDVSILENLKPETTFRFVASRHEYYVVQLLLVPEFNSKKLAISVGNLEGGERPIERAVTCFNTQGVTAEGVKYEKEIAVTAGVMQPIFFGIDFSKVNIGQYRTRIKIDKEDIMLVFDLNDKLVFNEGADSGKTLSRLKWLNSTAYRDKKLVKGFEGISTDKNEITLTGKSVLFGSDGLIENVYSYFGESNALTDTVQKELFYRPMELVLGGQKVKYNRLKLGSRNHLATLSADGKSDKVRVDVRAEASYEGCVNYCIKLTAESDVIISNIELNAYFACASYLVGLGKEGGKLTSDLDFKWNSALNQNSVFIGDLNCGARFKFTAAEKEVQPIVGFYKCRPIAVPVDGWDNYTKGGIRVIRTENGAVLTAYTGKEVMLAGQSKEFYFRIHLTPFKPVSMKEAFGYRQGEDGIEPSYELTLNRAKADNAGYVNLRNAGELNPYKNYPFDKIEELKQLALDAHKRDLGLGISYGVGSMSTKCREVFAYKSFGNELILHSDNYTGSDSALTDYLGMGAVEHGKISYRAGGLKSGKDMSFLTVPGSRMENYFVEGVDYLINNADLNAISMYDPAVCRDTFERVAKCVGRKKGISGVIELGISNQFNEKSGYANSLNQYTDVLPFADKIYVGEGFDITRSPDYVLTEMSGLLYGKTAESPFNNSICQSLLYGMLPKYGLDDLISRALRDLNAVLKDFGIEKSELKGFWDKTNPVRVDNENVLCTSYINGKNLITVLYNRNPKTVEFEIGVENKLGYTTVGKKVRTPLIEGLQNDKKVNFNKPMKIKGKTGMIIVVKA